MEFDTNQVNIFVVRTDDSPESAQKVNDIFPEIRTTQNQTFKSSRDC